MKKVLKLVFKNEDNELKSISISNMKEDLDELKIRTATDAMIAQNVMTIKDKNISGLIKASEITTEENVIIEA